MTGGARSCQGGYSYSPHDFAGTKGLSISCRHGPSRRFTIRGLIGYNQAKAESTMTDAFRSDQARPNYDPRRLYLASTDSHGHYRQTKLIYPPDVAIRVSELVESKGSGYRSRQDFYRDAIVHRLDQVGRWDDTPESVRQWVGEMTGQAMVETDLEMLKQRRQAVEACRRLLLEGGSPETVRAYLIALPDCPERDQLYKYL